MRFHLFVLRQNIRRFNLKVYWREWLCKYTSININFLNKCKHIHLLRSVHWSSSLKKKKKWKREKKKKKKENRRLLEHRSDIFRSGLVVQMLRGESGGERNRIWADYKSVVILLNMVRRVQWWIRTRTYFRALRRPSTLSAGWSFRTFIHPFICRNMNTNPP